MSKICPQRIVKEAIRLLTELNDPDALGIVDLEQSELDDNIEDLEVLVKALDKAQITNMET